VNKLRRKALRDIQSKIANVKDVLEEIMMEEEEYRDNIPENLQGSERYTNADEACEFLCEAVSRLEEAVESIETAIEE
jgi:hypothetical protein